jgi:hypothetical protein
VTSTPLKARLYWSAVKLVRLLIAGTWKVGTK